MTTPPHPRANPVLGSALDLRRSEIRTYDRNRHRDVEAVIAVGVLLQRVRIRSHKEDVPLDTAGFTLRPKGAVPMQPTAR